MLVLGRSGSLIESAENSPLLNSQRLVLRDPKPNHFALRIESIKINMGDDAQRVRSVGRGKLRELAIRELRTPPATFVQWR